MKFSVIRRKAPCFSRGECQSDLLPSSSQNNLASSCPARSHSCNFPQLCEVATWLDRAVFEIPKCFTTISTKLWRATLSAQYIPSASARSSEIEIFSALIPAKHDAQRNWIFSGSMLNLFPSRRYRNFAGCPHSSHFLSAIPYLRIART